MRLYKQKSQKGKKIWNTEESLSFNRDVWIEVLIEVILLVDNVWEIFLAVDIPQSCSSFTDNKRRDSERAEITICAADLRFPHRCRK